MANRSEKKKSSKPQKGRFIGLDSSGNTPSFPYVETKSSKIHNNGLFAAKTIPKDALIIQYLGELISKNDSSLRGLDQVGKSQSQNVGSVYIFDLDEKHDLDGNFEWNLARLANHSCEPNCEAQDIEGEIWFVALKEIQKGDELTFNYGYALEHWEDHPCHCGSKNCIGYIIREEDRRELQKILKKQT